MGRLDPGSRAKTAMSDGRRGDTPGAASDALVDGERCDELAE